MAHLALLALLRLVGKDRNLLRLAVLQNLARNACALNIRSADLRAVLVADCDDRELDRFVFIGRELFDIDDVAVLNLVLLTARPYS